MLKLTIFTPTYNRGYILPNLYESLLVQECKDFEWLVIDDGSTDDTPDLFKQWLSHDNGFPIRYCRVENGGKQRAINRAVMMAESDYFFIVDSDDTLRFDAVSVVTKWIESLPQDNSFAGLSGLRYNMAMSAECQPKSEFPDCGYIDCTNLDREKYGLSHDLAEIYKTEILKKYPFRVWDGETFTPECVVWDKIALDGYKLRYYNKYIYNFEYLPDGLTKGGYLTYKNNIMGCTMANDMKARTSKTLKDKYKHIVEMLVGCILTGNLRYIGESYYPKTALFMLPIAWLYSSNRKRILRRIK